MYEARYHALHALLEITLTVDTCFKTKNKRRYVRCKVAPLSCAERNGLAVVSSLKRLSFHLFRVDRLIQLPYSLARPDLERIRRFRQETVKGGLNMRKELEARALRLQKPKGLV